MDFLDPLFLVKTLGTVGVIAIIFAESGLFFGFFLPGDSLLFTAGLLASQGYLSFWPLLVGSLIAAIVGDSVGYAFGRHVGPKIFAREDSRFFKKSYVERTKVFYERHGKKAVILARFIPIVRTFAPILAGVGGMHYRTFLSYNIIGGILWSVGLIVLGFVLGKTIPNVDHYILPIIVGIIIVSMIPNIFEYMRSRKQQQIR
ncbi:MAG: VTT domain-containing protein [Candidatus Taylorbacteria bacterium]|nr:VTT domain-containing protein [Candidatus Taylorbacteria bacterium]